MRRSRYKYVISIVVLAAVYLLGGYSDRHELFPFSAIHRARAFFISKEPGRFSVDEVGRLASDVEKLQTDCPRQTPRTAVLLIIGQSNAGNHAGQGFRSAHEGKVANFYRGSCSVAESPLLGADGTQGEYWTELGNLLIEAGAFDSVMLAPAAITGSEVSRWAKGGNLNDSMTDTATQLQRSGYQVTHVLWVQGEINYVIGTSEKDYRDRFMSLVESLRSVGVSAPIYVSVASKCLGKSNGGTNTHSLDNPVSRAQKSLPNIGVGLKQGVDSDVLLDRLDRYDECHFSATGEQKVAKAWAGLLSNNP